MLLSCCHQYLTFQDKRRRLAQPVARVLTGDEVLQEPRHENNKGQRIATTDKPADNDSVSGTTNNIRVPVEVHPEPSEQEVTCPLCKEGVDKYVSRAEDSKWVGCDTCDSWYHRECLEPDVRAKADLSTMLDSDWSCDICQPAVATSTICKITNGATENVQWISCSLCDKAYHKSCLTAKELRALKKTNVRHAPCAWMCKRCYKKWCNIRLMFTVQE